MNRKKRHSAAIVLLLCTLTVGVCHARVRNPFLAEVSTFTLDIVSNIDMNIDIDYKCPIEDFTFLCRENALPVSIDRSLRKALVLHDDPPTPTLWARVDVTTVSLGKSVTASYAIHMVFTQPGKTVTSGTIDGIISWTSGVSYGTCLRKSLRQVIKKELEEDVESFAREWFAAHLPQ
jgi:hypothetical protein